MAVVMEDLDEDAMEPATGASFGELLLTEDIERQRRIFLGDYGDCELSGNEDVYFWERLKAQTLIYVEQIRKLLDPCDCSDERIGLPVRQNAELRTLGKYTPQSLRTFIHTKNSSAGQLLRLLKFVGDLLSVVHSSNLSESAVFKNLEYCIHQAIYQILLEKLFGHFLSSAVVVLFLFEYLMGYIERGGWATYSDTSWEFRATYVSIELRLAAYFWFKFRAWPVQPSPADARGHGTPDLSAPAESTAGGHKRKAVVHHRGKTNKFEPKLKALRTGETNKTDIWLGDYPTLEEAVDVYWIGSYYYDQRDLLRDDDLSWCDANLPPLPPNLSVAEKASWVRGQAKDFLPRRRHQDQGGVAGEAHPGRVAVEQDQGAGYVDVPVISGTGGRGSLPPTHDILFRSPPPSGDTEFMLHEIRRAGLYQADSTGIGLGQCDLVGITGDEYIVGPYSAQGEVSGQGVGNEGLDSLRTSRDQSAACHQEEVQRLQESHGNAIVLEGGGAVAETGETRQDETEEHSLLRASPNIYTAAVDVPNVAQELKVTDTIRSTFRELRERGWDNLTWIRRQGGVAVEQDQGAGYVDVPSGTEGGGSLAPIDDILGSLSLPCGDIEFTLPEIMRAGGFYQADSTGKGLRQSDHSDDITVDEYMDYSRQGEVSGLGVGNEGPNSLETCRDQNACHLQDVQHLQQSHGRAIVLGCRGVVPEIGAILRRDESEEHPALKASANCAQAVDLPIVAQELEKLKFTDAIQSTFRELHERGWDFEIQPRVSDEFYVEYPRCVGQERLMLTGTNYYAFLEIHKQGFQIILKPISNASPQDGNGRPQSRSCSRDLCRSCNARLFVE